ncbi:MAG: hypothetical protein WCR98_03145, partial [Saccharofermentanales bacterium]
HQGEENYKKILQNAQVDAERGYDDIIKKAKEGCSQLTAKAEKNLDSAVSIILKKVVVNKCPSPE